MDKRAVLYQLESPSGKLYMGITTRFKHRMNQHARSVGGKNPAPAPAPVAKPKLKK